MSWGTCYSGSNNIHFDFPPIMSDGRNFSKWQPGAKINEELRNYSVFDQHVVHIHRQAPVFGEFDVYHLHPIQPRDVYL